MSVATDASSDLYFNGTVVGDGLTQTVDVPAPSNGTVWDLVSAKITISASGPVGISQNSYLYDSTCSALDVAPAPSACSGVYGPNVDTLANDVMESGKDGTVVGEGGYTPTAPAGVAIYIYYEQTIHLNHDMFISFGADISIGVSSSYYLVFDPEVGDYPSFAFYRWQTPVQPLSSTPTTVYVSGPPSGHYYRAEIATSSIDLGSSSLTPTRSAEILEEPGGRVLSSIDSWSVAGPGVTEFACGGYSSSQTCISNPTGTETIWNTQVLVNSSEYFEARFVGVSGDLGVFAIVVTEYPVSTASGTPAAPTDLSVGVTSDSQLELSWSNPSGALTDSYIEQYSGSNCAGAATEVNVGAVVSSYEISGLSPGTSYSYEVAAANSTGVGAWSACASGTTDAGPPVAPTDLSATPASSNSIDLQWANPSGVVTDDYVSTFSGSGCTGASGSLNLGSEVDTYTVTGLSSSTSYSYEVKASNSAGTGPASDCASATTSSSGSSTQLTTVRFTEEGLAPGALWWVSVNGSQSANLTSTGTAITFSLANGSYQYSVGTHSDANASQAEGTFIVPSSPSTIPVSFTDPSTSTAVGPPPSALGVGETAGLAVAAIGLAGGFVIGTARAIGSRPNRRGLRRPTKPRSR